MLQKNEWFAFGVTFFMGLVGGVYLYISGAASFLEDLQMLGQDKAKSFVLSADRYGACQSSCPSLHVEADGSYVYLYTTTGSTKPTRVTGTLSYSLLRDLKRTLLSPALISQGAGAVAQPCYSYTGGIDTHYTVWQDEVVYELDTCKTAVDTNGAFMQVLESVWSQVEKDIGN